MIALLQDEDLEYVVCGEGRSRGLEYCSVAHAGRMITSVITQTNLVEEMFHREAPEYY